MYIHFREKKINVSNKISYARYTNSICISKGKTRENVWNWTWKLHYFLIYQKCTLSIRNYFAAWHKLFDIGILMTRNKNYIYFIFRFHPLQILPVWSSKWRGDLMENNLIITLSNVASTHYKQWTINSSTWEFCGKLRGWN